MTRKNELEKIQDENKQLKQRIKKMENFLYSSNAEFIESPEDPGLLTRDYFNVMSRDYMYRILIENMNEGALIVNQQKIIVYSNKHFASIIDHPLQKTIGRNFYSFFNEQNKYLMQECFQVSERGKKYCEVKMKTGKDKNITAIISLISFPVEDKIYYCVIVNDISDHTEIKEGLEIKIEQQLQELIAANNRLTEVNRELNNMNQYLDNFVHTLAHDLRAPLANLMLVEELIAVAPDKQRDKLMKSVHDNVYKLDKILKGLVEILKIQGAKEKNHPDISVLDVINEILEEKEFQIRKKDAKITVQGRKDYKIDFIEAYLKSIIRNLISNALKYSKTFTKPEIHIELNKTPDYFIISVKDNGVGIDMKKEGKDLFKAFQRITSKAEGLGVGLHNIENMVRKNGGYINVESKPGLGSTFTVYLKEYHS